MVTAIKTYQKQSIEVCTTAGMVFDIKEIPCSLLDESAVLGWCHYVFSNKKVLYRSDTKTALSVVSTVISRTATAEYWSSSRRPDIGFELETAGVLKERAQGLGVGESNSHIKGNDIVSSLFIACHCM